MSEISNTSGRSLLKGVASLEEFRLPFSEIAPVYHDALNLPPFLNTNLRAKDRKVKEFTGDQAVIRAFYFALMRLAFDLENERDYATIVRTVLTGDEQFGAGELEDRDLSDVQYRQFLEEFMKLLQQEGPFQEAIKPYPVIDSILLRMFRQLVPVTLQLRDDSQQRVAERILAFLAAKFDMQMEAVGGCFKLVEPDMFVYVSNLNLVYLVYVEELGDIREEDEEDSEGRDISLSAGSISASKIIGSQIQGKRESGGNQPDSKAGKGGNFKTVINILESNKSVPSKSSERNSMETALRKAKIDSIKENLQEDSNRSQPLRQTLPSQLQPPPTSPRPSHQTSLHSSSSQSTVTIHSNTSKTTSKHLSNPAQSYQPSQSSSSSSQYSKSSLHSKSPSEFSSTPLKPSELRSYEASGGEIKMVKTYGGVGQCKQEEYLSKFSSQIYTQGKPSNLGIFSSVNPAVKPPMADTEESVCDDSGYEKFTDSKVLDLLDNQFRQQIKVIKKKYRAQRNNIRRPI